MKPTASNANVIRGSSHEEQRRQQQQLLLQNIINHIMIMRIYD